MEVQTLTTEQPQRFTLHSTISHPKGEDLVHQTHASTDARRIQQKLATSAWAHSTESSNDFRSDFLTKPTMRMLEAIISTSLNDGDMGEDTTTNSLCSFVADLVGHEAALLVMSGSMGNQVALRSAVMAPPHSILADHRSHIINWESGGASSFCATLIKSMVPSNGHHVTLADVKKHCVLTDTYYDAPTRVISLENTLWGTIMPLSDIRDISHWARAQTPPIHMHLDGARLWEAAAAGSCTLREAGDCFDSITMCFTKGLGAPIGSIVTGSSAFIKRANWARKHLGGSTRASGVIAAPARVAIEDVFLGGRLKAAQDKARFASGLWERLGGKLQFPTETNMVWLDLEGSGLSVEEFEGAAATFDIRVGEPVHGRLAFHYQTTDAVVARLCELFKVILGKENIDSVRP